jgi:hypothetical protein
MNSQTKQLYVGYERQVNRDLAAYAKQLRNVTKQQYGSAVAAEIEQFLTVLLEQNPLPGILVLIGYTLEGGQDDTMIIRAARAVAMFRAVVSMQHGDASLQNAARAGEHAAQIILANLEVDAEVNRRAVSIMNRTMLLTAHADAEQRENPDSPQVAAWQALERAVNPIHIGMVLAGADCHATDDITPLATDLGMALVRGEESADQLLETLLQG